MFCTDIHIILDDNEYGKNFKYDVASLCLGHFSQGTKQYIILMEISKQMDILKSVQLRLEKKLLKILPNEKNFGVVCVVWAFFAHI